jgi:thiol-disulfide isomerase/thioredoxin
MMPRAAIAGWGVMGVAGTLLALNLMWVVPNCSAYRPIKPGDEAPNFVLPTITADGVGEPRVALGEYRGKVVLIDFWATWCGPCRSSMPAIERMYARYQDQGLEVISINTEGPEAARAAFEMARRLSPSVRLVSDSGAVSNQFRVTTIPHMVAIDRSGVVRMVHRGFPGLAELEAHLTTTIENLLAE